MQTDTIHHDRHHLIAGNRAILFFQPDVVPDNIIRIEQAAALHIRFGQPHSRQMVTIEYDYRRLAALVHHVHQIRCKLIHFVYLIDIVFPLAVLFLRFQTACHQVRMLNDTLLRIAAVPLIADGKYKVLLLRGIQTILDMLQKHLVLCPTGFCRVKIHKFLTGEGIKANVIVYLRSAVEIPAVVMHRMRAVIKCRQRRCRAFRSLFLQIALIRIFAGAEITHAHARQHFKFRICRACADGRHLTIAGGIFRSHFSQIRQGILRGLQCRKFGNIKERLQLHEKHIRQHLCIGGAFCNLAIVADFHHFFLRVAVWLGNARIKNTCRKAIGQTVVLICKRDIREIGRNDTVLNDIIRQYAIACEGSPHKHNGYHIIDFPLKSPCRAEQMNQPQHQKNQDNRNPCQLQHVKIIREKGNPLRDRFQILCIKRRNPSGKHQPIGQPQKQPEKAEDEAGKHTPLA